jgi:hypothetical protein
MYTVDQWAKLKQVYRHGFGTFEEEPELLRLERDENAKAGEAQAAILEWQEAAMKLERGEKSLLNLTTAAVNNPWIGK